jgi:hypothetical protein
MPTKGRWPDLNQLSTFPEQVQLGYVSVRQKLRKRGQGDVDQPQSFLHGHTLIRGASTVMVPNSVWILWVWLSRRRLGFIQSLHTWAQAANWLRRGPMRHCHDVSRLDHLLAFAFIIFVPAEWQACPRPQPQDRFGVPHEDRIQLRLQPSRSSGL